MAKDATKDAPKPAAKPQAAAKPSGDKAQRKKGEGAAQAPSIAKGRPKGTGTVPARLKETFHKALLPALMKARGYANPWQVPRLEKIVINMGVGEGRENAKVLDFATAELQAITGQKPVVTRAKKSIANFKLRGRPRAYLRKFEMCRLCFRELALKGEVPGIVKASW